MVHVLLEESSHVLLLGLFSHVSPKVEHSERIRRPQLWQQQRLRRGCTIGAGI